MKRTCGLIGFLFACVALTGCVGPKKYEMKSIPADSYGDKIESREALLEEGHFMGHSASRQEASLANMIVATNNSDVQEFAKLETLEVKDLKISEETLAAVKEVKDLVSKDLQASEAALTLLKSYEALSKFQGTGEITLFFGLNDSTIAKSGENHQRLVHFLDYLGTNAHGRKVKFLLVGSASATGKSERNTKLSEKRANAPVEIIDTYLVNLPHETLKVYGVGDSLSSKDAKTFKKFQNVRVIAVYDEAQAPALPEKK